MISMLLRNAVAPSPLDADCVMSTTYGFEGVKIESLLVGFS